MLYLMRGTDVRSFGASMQKNTDPPNPTPNYESLVVSGNLVPQYPTTFLGSPVVPFCPFCLGVSLLKPNMRKKGTLIIKGLLGNLVLGSDNLFHFPVLLGK